MLIQSIANTYFNINKTYSGRQKQSPISYRAPLKVDTVSFGRCKEEKALKELLHLGIPDLYSDRILIAFEDLQLMMKKQIFSLPLRQLVKILEHYSKCLKPVHKEVYENIKRETKFYPKEKLESFISKLVPEHNKLLCNLQMPIFDELSTLAKQMPREQREEFEKLMQNTKKQLYNQSVSKEFNAKDFRYKLQRIAERNKSKDNSHLNAIMRKLQKLAQLLPSATDEEFITKKIIKLKRKKTKKIDNIQRDLIRQKANIIRQMTKLITNKGYTDDRELQTLLNTARMQIYNIPIIIPFQRKVFIQELQQITSQLKDKKLANKMVQCATKLPKSGENISAFIMKCAGCSADRIGYELFAPSVGSVDHLDALGIGGEDNINNYALTSSDENSKKAHMNLKTWIKKHPEMYEYAQRQIDRYIELYNDGTFRRIGLGKGYIINFANKLRRNSPEENPMILDLSKLK